MMEKLKNNSRMIIQLIYTAITNGNIKGFLEGRIYQGGSKQICVPGLNCYSCPGALGACPIGSLQAVTNSRNFSLSFYVLGFITAFGALFGKLICGFLCPFGLVQDLLHKIPFVKKVKKLPLDKYLRRLKYIILAVFVIGLPMAIKNVAGMGSPWFCKYVCPSGTLMGGLPLIAKNPGLQDAIGGLFVWKMFILVGIVFLSIVVYRPFCRYLCPLGAIYGLFNPIAIYRYEFDEDACIDCGICQKTCKLDIPAYEDVNSSECIRCGDCIRACPTDAICSNLPKLKGDGKMKDLEEI